MQCRAALGMSEDDAGGGLDLDGGDLAVFAFDEEIYLVTVVGSPVSPLCRCVKPVELSAYLTDRERLQQVSELCERRRRRYA